MNFHVLKTIITNFFLCKIRKINPFHCIRGFSGDGSVGASTANIQIIGKNTDNYVQLYHKYDSKKEGGSTDSHMRYGPVPINSEYLINSHCDLILCSKNAFMRKYNILETIKEGGIFLLNTLDKSVEEFEANQPPAVLRQIAQKNVKLYVVDAGKIAKSVG